MNEKTGAGLVDYARHQIGMGYWWGCYGQLANETLLSVKTKQYPEVYKSPLYQDAKNQFGKRVFDCSGLIKGYLWSLRYDSEPSYNPAQDANALGIFTQATESGLIESMPEIEGILVFTKTLDHVGVYVGNGEVIEAMGHKNGVLLTKLQNRNFYRWAKCVWISYPDESPSYIEPYFSLSEKDKKFIDKLGQIKLGDSGFQVMLLERLLVGMNKFSDPKDVYSDELRRAVMRFQKEENLEEDGICGKNTWTQLIKRI